MAQWLERGALPLSLPAVRFRIPLGEGFLEKYHASPLSLLGHCFDVVSLGTKPKNVPLDSGENEYLVRQNWQSI